MPSVWEETSPACSFTQLQKSKQTHSSLQSQTLSKAALLQSEQSRKILHAACLLGNLASEKKVRNSCKDNAHAQHIYLSVPAAWPIVNCIRTVVWLFAFYSWRMCALHTINTFLLHHMRWCTILKYIRTNSTLHTYWRKRPCCNWRKQDPLFLYY